VVTRASWSSVPFAPRFVMSAKTSFHDPRIGLPSGKPRSLAPAADHLHRLKIRIGIGRPRRSAFIRDGDGRHCDDPRKGPGSHFLLCRLCAAGEPCRDGARDALSELALRPRELPGREGKLQKLLTVHRLSVLVLQSDQRFFWSSRHHVGRRKESVLPAMPIVIQSAEAVVGKVLLSTGHSPVLS